ncbi:MAG: hypothetical protein RSG96_00825 [Clostridia bacterium]
MHKALRHETEIKAALDAKLSAISPDPFFASRVLRAAKGEEKVKNKVSVGLVLTLVLVLVAAVALAATAVSAYYERVSFANNTAYGKWSVWVGSDSLLPELDRIDALVDQLSDGLYEEDTVMDAAARVNPEVNATEKKALRTALYSFWNVADPDFFDLDTFDPSNHKASVVYEENRDSGIGIWHVRLNPTEKTGLPYYYAEINAMDNQFIRIHKLNENGTKTLKILYFGVIEWGYDEFIAMGQSG